MTEELATTTFNYTSTHEAAQIIKEFGIHENRQATIGRSSSVLMDIEAMHEDLVFLCSGPSSDEASFKCHLAAKGLLRMYWKIMPG